MTATDIYRQPLSLIDLSLLKALTRLSADALATLEKVETLNVDGFSEPEVRTFVIDPIIKVLGYDKETDFSVDLGKRIQFLNKKRFPDYKFNLWREDFWVMEAKKPSKGKSFGYKALAQAAEYAHHPKINAALVVLCDGRKIEVFDVEESVIDPALHVDIKHLRRDFEKLRHFLEPWQVWFFQKRRIVRLIDKVFDKEFNLGRLEEFRRLIDHRVVAKRSLVLENFRRNVTPDFDQRKEQLEKAPTADLIEAYLFLENPHPMANALTRTLVTRSASGTFLILSRMLPDVPRDVNDAYFAQVVKYLVELGQTRTSTEWLPAWLTTGNQNKADLEAATKRLIRHCLSHFSEHEAWKSILLAANAFRRIFKIMMLGNEAQWHMGALRHMLHRYLEDERSWSQLTSSPEGHVLGMIDGGALRATHQFVAQCYPPQELYRPEGPFKTEVARRRLNELWNLEVALLGNIGNYPKLRAERNLGEMRMTEASGITFDYLGHMTLCYLPQYPKWIEYVTTEHRSPVEELARLGSFRARELLGIDQRENMPRVPDAELANRFFYGDIAILKALRDGYAERSSSRI
ncbi:Type I restriction enzyme R protein N terminus (HSDR_N) [Enhydrobacter aerosaccus]|uniref:Type I restriction enzyme R protein N terminus (HSDR_N) n=1 Tax=Enhydrobacter aerosaccus TaxID=225324 RepID=A0A1T4S923_9HYPH|nr:type I restriction enzyme HsdR N-terminal domain-containing protein [Enhydrobacter aerosaccus]SKA24677.1 Type I restriction enzyme R protein N terminus (HSDR_N) [Enhydrobacter aerosaccus]